MNARFAGKLPQGGKDGFVFGAPPGGGSPGPKPGSGRGTPAWTAIQTALARLSEGECPYPPTPETDVVVVVRRFVPVTVRHSRVPGIIVPRTAAERWGLVPMGPFSQKVSPAAAPPKKNQEERKERKKRKE
jgi:hypothetical protein